MDKKTNQAMAGSLTDKVIENCLGQRYIGCGASSGKITIHGTPGNALGAYMNGGTIEVFGNAQDAVGDTMNEGKIIVHGNAGDALGYAMRGGKIFVRGNAGYRAGIHMKEYGEKKPVMIIGGGAGSFLGEYLAGGLIVVLGIGKTVAPIGNFTGTGMHGGSMFIRTDAPLPPLPSQVSAEIATADEIARVVPYITEFAGDFGLNPTELSSGQFYMLKPNAKNPYHKLYTAN